MHFKRNLKSAACIGLVLAFGCLSQFAAAKDDAKFFRVAEVSGAWWFVAPDGKPFFSSGVNVIDVGGTPERYSPQRPEYAAFRHYADTTSWAAATEQRLREWGFNTVGGWSAQEMTNRNMPYTYVLHLGKELGVPWNDLFAADFDEQITSAAERVVPQRSNDPNLIGWYTDNELAWFADTLFTFHIAQPASSATRQQLVKLLRQHYQNDFGKLEQDFVTEGAADFEQLAAGGKLLLRSGGRGMAVADEFLRIVAERFYASAEAGIRKFDQNHLILGDRYHGYCPDAVTKAAAAHVDVISTNFDQPVWTDGRLPRFYLERLHRISRKPILITEYYVAASDNRSGNKNSGDIFTIVETQQERAAALRTRLTWFASLPYVVGAHWFQFTDEPTHGRSDGEDYNFGLIDIEDRPYVELTAAFKATNAAVPEIHEAAGRAQGASSAAQISVPTVSGDPLAKTIDWDQWQASMPSSESTALGDLLVCADEGSTYLAVSCSTFVDPNAYPEGGPGADEQYSLEFAIGDSRPCTVQFGVGDDYTVSDSRVKVRVHQRGMRYLVVVALPTAIADPDSSKPADGKSVQLTASLEDQRRGDRTTWSSRLAASSKLATSGNLPTNKVIREAQSTSTTLAQ